MGWLIKLPWPPSANTYYRSVMVRGRPVTSISKQGREYRKAVIGEVWALCSGRPEPLTGRLCVSLELYPPDRRKRDLDNHDGKALWDALTHAGVWEDDSQIDERHTYRRQIVKGGMAIVEISELMEPES